MLHYTHMKPRKEVTLAIIMGLFLALVIAGGIYRAKTAIQNFDPTTLLPNNAKTTDKSDEKSPQTLFLELDTPDNSVTDKDKLTLSGKTLPGTYIAITTEANDYLIVPSDTGIFSQEVTLIRGANLLTVTVFTSLGEKVTQSRSVVYTTQAL